MTTIKAEFEKLMAILHEDVDLPEDDRQQVESAFYAGAAAFWAVLCAGQKANDHSVITRAADEVFAHSETLCIRRQVREN